jgi:hypothetical protein
MSDISEVNEPVDQKTGGAGARTRRLLRPSSRLMRRVPPRLLVGLP